MVTRAVKLGPVGGKIKRSLPKPPAGNTIRDDAFDLRASRCALNVQGGSIMFNAFLRAVIGMS